MPGKYSRNKGRRLEQEVVNVFKRHDVDAKRVSMMETGHEDKGDVEIGGVWKGEVKGGGHVPKFIYDAKKTEDTDFLLMKRDRREWQICMDLEFFLNSFYND